MIDQIRQVAVKAAEQAGEMARQKFGSRFDMEKKGEDGDLVTEVDFETEKLILAHIEKHFPDHQIHSEETGVVGDECEWLWVVDPLDGTNNFALGLPLYGVSIAVLHRGKPVVGVVVDSPMADTYVAVKGQGAWKNGQRLQVKETENLKKSTLAWVQGHGVKKSNHQARTLKHALDHSYKRILRSWAPSISWAMIARGDIHGMVLYRSEGMDMYAGLLLVQEAGGKVTDFQGNPFDRYVEEPYLVAAAPGNHDELLQWVQGVMGDDKA